MEDYLAGQRYPLGLITTDGSVYQGAKPKMQACTSNA